MSEALSKQDRAQLAQVIATWLEEKSFYSRCLIDKVLRELGKERTFAILQRTLEQEQAGGLLTLKGTRRTIGGVFFYLARQECTPEELVLIWPPKVWKETRQRMKIKRQNARKRPQKAAKTSPQCT